MEPSTRIRSAVVASLMHLGASGIVALICAGLVFGLWYPYPYGELVGGQGLFLLLISVDVVCGPVLTFVVFNPRKPRPELWRDVSVIVMLQLSALAYGLWTTVHARPVFLAFEGDRFRVVSIPDIDIESLASAPRELADFGLIGPRPLGVRLAESTDPDFPQSIQLALKGLPPSFRPGRWVHYEQQRQSVIAAARPMSSLRARYPQQRALIDDGLGRLGLAEESVGYLPLIAGRHTDWVVIIRLADAEPSAFLPLDGW